MSPGPCKAFDLNPINIRVGSNMDGEAITAQLQVTLPLSAQRCPLVVLSAGFLLDGSSYRSYAQDLASWGYVAVLYDISEIMDDAQTVSAISSMINTCLADPQIAPCVDVNCILLAGHSRGGKLSVLTAARDSRIKGLALFDPVNNTEMTPNGPGYPSALLPLRQMTQPPRNMPVLIVGASLNKDVIPEDANYRRFDDACAGPSWLVELRAGHLQFLDKHQAIFSFFAATGPLPDTAIRAVSKAAMIAWFETVAKPAAAGVGVDVRAVQGLLELEASALRNQAPGTAYSLRNLSNLPSRTGSSSNTSSTSSASSASSQTGSSASSASGSGAGPSSGPGPRPAPVTASYDELMRMRATELKRMLQERGVPCADCFDKEALARRIVERCSAQRVA